MTRRVARPAPRRRHPRPSTATRTQIPRILHHIWVGGPLPNHYAAYRRWWKRLHPHWEHRLWRDRDLQWLEHRDLYDRWGELAPRNAGQFRANIARLEVLYRHGGVYLDCDMEPTGRCLDDLLDPPAGAFCVWQREPGHRKGPMASNAMLGAVAGHPAMRTLIDGIPVNVAEHTGRRSTYTTGVRYLTSRLDGLYIDVLPASTCFPYLPDQIRAWDAGQIEATGHAVHHWGNNRAGGHVGPWA